MSSPAQQVCPECGSTLAIPYSVSSGPDNKLIIGFRFGQCPHRWEVLRDSDRALFHRLNTDETKH
jgi:hypothetical protein